MSTVADDLRANGEAVPSGPRSLLRRLDRAVAGMGTRHVAAIFALVVAFFFVLFAAGFAVLAKGILAKERERLDAIAVLEMEDIEAWLADHRQDVSTLSGNSVFRELITPLRIPSRGGWSDRLGAWADAQRAISWLEQNRRIYGYRSVDVVAPDGRSLVAVGAAPYTTAEVVNLVERARSSQAPVLRDLHAGDGWLYLLIAERLPDVHDLEPLVLVYTTEAQDHLLRRAHRWPSAARAGELLVHRREGNRVALLSDSRRGASEKLVLSPASGALPVEAAMRDGDGVHAGVDAGGIEVIGAVHRVRSMPWLVTAQVQRDSVMAPVWRLALLFGALALGGAVGGWVLLLLFWRAQELRLDHAAVLNRELEQKSIDALAAARAKSSFLANMSHEIRTPLNAVIGLTLLLRSRATKGTWEADRLDQVATSARHLLGIVNDVLDVSRIESGKLQLEETEFTLDELVSERLLGILAQRLREKGLEFVIDVDPVLAGPLRGDPLRLAQALLNYLGNAIKFTDRGRIALAVRCLQEDDTSLVVRFDVSDTGVGLGPEQVSRLFSTFEQADASTTRRFGGSGLGLAITRHLAVAMGGEVGVDSEVGRGSTFWFTARLQRGTASPARRVPAVRSRKVLVADDLVEVSQVLVAMLQRLGMRCEAATDGTGVLAAIARAEASGDPFELVMLDWSLPGTTIGELLRGSRNRRQGPAPLVMALLPLDNAVAADLAKSEGAVCSLAKPVTASSLLEALLALDASARRQTSVQDESALPDGTSSLAGCRVLLVEDNAINREVMIDLLAGMGMRIELAVDGGEAVERAATERFDLILMDMQMPVMDGLEATRRIRGLPGGASTPIVAMTANAFSEDRKACLLAGMNDHLAKPVDPDRLRLTIQRWVDDAAAGSPLPDAAPPVTGSTCDPAPPLSPAIGEPLLDEDRLKRLPAGIAGGAAGLLARFARLHAGDGDALQRLIGSQDWQAAYQLVHKLKGSAGTIGARRLQVSAEAVERSLRRGVRPEPAAMDGLLASTQVTIDEMSRRIGATAGNEAGGRTG